MAELKSIRLEKQELDAIEDMAEQGVADNQSEAHRQLLRAGMHEYGYRNGDYTDTTLRTVIQRFAHWFIVAGIVWTGVTWYYPRVFATPAIGLFLSGLACWGIDRVLEQHEPRVSNRLKGLFVGEKA